MSATFVSARSAFIEHAVPVLSGRPGSRSAANLGMPVASSLPAAARHLDIADRIDSVLLTADRWMESLRQLDIPDRPPRKVESALKSLAAGSAESVDLLIEATELLLRELRKALLDAPQAIAKSFNSKRDNLHQLCCDVGGIPNDLMQGDLVAGSAALRPGQFELFAVKEWRNAVVHEGVSGPVAVRTVLTAWLYVLDRHWCELRARTDTLICRPFGAKQSGRLAPIRQDFLQPFSAAGRESELAKLDTYREETNDAVQAIGEHSGPAGPRAGQFLVISGNEGAGKTRLLSMWLERLAHSGAQGREASGVRHVAFWLPHALVWSARSGEGVQQLVPCLRAQANTILLVPLAGQAGEDSGTMAPVPGSAPTAEGWTPEAAKQELIALCEAVVREVGSCVIVIDGADELQGQGGARAVEEFVRLLPQQPPSGTLFVLGCRSDTQTLKKLRHRRVVHTMELGPLHRGDVEAILAPLGSAATARLDDVMSQTGGHAMHVVAARQILGDNGADNADLSKLDEEFVRRKVAEFMSPDIGRGGADPLRELLKFMAFIGQFVDVPMADLESWLKRRPCGYDVQRVREWLGQHGETIQTYDAHGVERLRVPWRLVLKRARDNEGRDGAQAMMTELARWVVEEVRDGDGVCDDSAFAVGQLFRTAPKRLQSSLLKLLDEVARSRPWPVEKFPGEAAMQIWNVVEGWCADDKRNEIRFDGEGLALARVLAEATKDNGVRYWLAQALWSTGENEAAEEADGIIERLASRTEPTTVPCYLAHLTKSRKIIDISPHADAAASDLARDLIAIDAEEQPIGAGDVIARLREGTWTDGTTGESASVQFAQQTARLTRWASSTDVDLANLATAMLRMCVPDPEDFRADCRIPVEASAVDKEAVQKDPILGYFQELLGEKGAVELAAKSATTPNGRARYQVMPADLRWLRRLELSSGVAREDLLEEFYEYLATGPYQVVRPLAGGWLTRLSRSAEVPIGTAIQPLVQALAVRGQRECWAARLALTLWPGTAGQLIQFRSLAEQWPESLLPWWRVEIAAAYLVEDDQTALSAIWQEIQRSPRVDRVPWMALPKLAGLAAFKGDVFLARTALEQHLRVEPGLTESIAVQEFLYAAIALLADDLPAARLHFARVQAAKPTQAAANTADKPAPQAVPQRGPDGRVTFVLRRDLAEDEVEAIWLQVLETIH